MERLLQKIIVASAALLTLAACGSRIPLTPPEGQSLPPNPRAAQEAPTPQELMEPSAQARPGRSDELLKQSKKREPDEFDLPPTN
jgi:predicted small lipoprotein YifL